VLLRTAADVAQEKRRSRSECSGVGIFNYRLSMIRDRARYEEQWREIEDQFDHAELAALARADALTATVLAECGYPMESFEQRAADLSVDHP
jgi:hypothetical protein